MLASRSRIAMMILPALILAAGFVCAVQAVCFAAADSSTGNPTLVPLAPKQGQPLVVFVTVPAGTAPPAVTFNKKNYTLYPADASASGSEPSYRALIGVPADLPPGSYSLTVGDREQKVTIKPGGFGVQRISLPKSKDNFVSSPGEEEAVKAAKAVQTPEQRWRGSFVRPSKARTSTQFGLRRIVNGHLLTDYFHSGLDFAGGLGTPVLATQKGRVILAHSGWRLHGNTVALDHGQGVISFYIHLSKILVKTGEVVEAGQEIGKVGATGRASGPHLHFSVYVNGDATNPMDWFTRKI